MEIQIGADQMRSLAEVAVEIDRVPGEPNRHPVEYKGRLGTFDGAADLEGFHRNLDARQGPEEGGIGAIALDGEVGSDEAGQDADAAIDPDFRLVEGGPQIIDLIPGLDDMETGGQHERLRRQVRQRREVCEEPACRSEIGR